MTRKPIGGISARRGFRVVAVPQEARGDSSPAPVEGWDAISPLAAMPVTRAITMRNMFPQPGYVEIRKGHKAHNLIGAAAIESLMTYHGQAPADDRMFAAASTTISNVTVYTTASASSTSSVSLTGFGSARFQHVNFPNTAGNWLWICNGVDVPHMYNGTVWATASVVGITSTTIINVAIFKNRLWLVRKDLMSPAYLAADAVQGTATVFDLVGIFKHGGYLQAIGTCRVTVARALARRDGDLYRHGPRIEFHPGGRL
jgi:hypothetical protein